MFFNFGDSLAPKWKKPKSHAQIMKKSQVSYSKFVCTLDEGKKIWKSRSNYEKILSVILLLQVYGYIMDANWFTYGALTVLLAANRIISMGSENLHLRIFAGKKTIFFICFCFLYGILLVFLIGSPISFSRFCAKLDFLFFVNDFSRRKASIHDLALTIFLPILYFVQWIFLRKKLKKTSTKKFCKWEKKLVYQIFAIIFSTHVSTIFRTIFAWIPTNFLRSPLIFAFLFVSLWTAGGNSIIYLVFNFTIRQKIFVMFKGIFCGVSSENRNQESKILNKKKNTGEISEPLLCIKKTNSEF